MVLTRGGKEGGEGHVGLEDQYVEKNMKVVLSERGFDIALPEPRLKLFRVWLRQISGLG